MEILPLKKFSLFQILCKSRSWFRQETFIYKSATYAVSFTTLESPKPYQVSFKCLYHRPGLENQSYLRGLLQVRYCWSPVYAELVRIMTLGDI